MRGKQIRRIARGLYDKPKINGLTGKPTNVVSSDFSMALPHC